jgi:hypothetical protein
MEEQDYLETYDGQSIDELIELSNKHEAYEINYVLEIALDKKRDAGKELTKEETVALAIQAVDREVNNGGFSQFFYNSSVEFAPIIVESLKEIGCPITAELANKAINYLNVDVLEPEIIEEALDPDDEVLEGKLNDLDSLFYDGEEDLSGKLLEYVKTNKLAFQIT